MPMVAEAPLPPFMESRVSEETICRQTGLGRRAVRRHLRALEDRGLIMRLGPDHFVICVRVLESMRKVEA